MGDGRLYAQTTLSNLFENLEQPHTRFICWLARAQYAQTARSMLDDRVALFLTLIPTTAAFIPPTSVSVPTVVFLYAVSTDALA